jgi:hypothetical protein
MSHKIFITGDSWGCGEWTRDHTGRRISHKGLEQYFIEAGYEVFNSSEGGSSNASAIDRLLTNLIEHFNSEDYIFIFQTDPIRNLRLQLFEYNKHILTTAIQNADGIENLILDLIRTDYNKLNIIAQEYNTVVYVIGGLCNINLTLIRQFEYLIPLVSSFSHMLVGHMAEYKRLNEESIVLNPDWTINDINLNLYDYALQTKIVKELYKHKENSIISKEEIFHPDGVHPNRYGHRILFNYIKNKLSL